MPTASLLLSAARVSLTSAWSGYEAGYGEVRYTQPRVDGCALTLSLPPALHGAAFDSLSFNFRVVSDPGLRHIRFSGTGEEVSDAALLKRLNDGETEISLYFSFRAQGGHGGEGQHSASCAWQDLSASVTYVPAGGTGLNFTTAQGSEIALHVDACSLSPGESASASLNVRCPNDARRAIVYLSAEDASARDEFSLSLNGSGVYSFTVALQNAAWSGRLCPAQFEIRLYTALGEEVCPRSPSALMLCRSRLPPAPVPGWTDAETLPAAIGSFVQGKSRLRLSIQCALDTEADSTIHLAARSLTINGEVLPLAGDEAFVDTVNLPAQTSYTLSVTDNFGLTGSCSGVLTILPYASPSLSDVQLQRCIQAFDPLGQPYFEPDDGGNQLLASLSGRVSPLNGQNAWTLEAAWTGGGSTRSRVLAQGADGQALSWQNDAALFPELLSETESWLVTVSLTDLFESVSCQIRVPKAGGIFNIERGGVAVGMRSTGTYASPLFEAAYPAVFHAPVSFPGSDSGWIAPALSNVSEYSADYPVRARIKLGLLFLRGAIRLDALLPSGQSRPIMTLPDGLRPSFPAALWAGRIYGLSLFAEPSGLVTLYNNSGAAVTPGAFISVAGCIPAD